MDCSLPGSSVHGILWSGLPFPSPGDLPDPGIQPRSPTLQADSLPLGPETYADASWLCLSCSAGASWFHAAVFSSRESCCLFTSGCAGSLSRFSSFLALWRAGLLWLRCWVLIAAAASLAVAHRLRARGLPRLRHTGWLLCRGLHLLGRGWGRGPRAGRQAPNRWTAREARTAVSAWHSMPSWRGRLWRYIFCAVGCRCFFKRASRTFLITFV